MATLAAEQVSETLFRRWHSYGFNDRDGYPVRPVAPSNRAAPSNPPSASPEILCRCSVSRFDSHTAQPDRIARQWTQVTKTHRHPLSTDGSARREPSHRRFQHHRSTRWRPQVRLPAPGSFSAPKCDHFARAFPPPGVEGCSEFRLSLLPTRQWRTY